MNDVHDIRRAMAIFDLVCDMAPSERAAALEAQCAGNAEIRDRVERMLAVETTDGALFAGSKHGIGAMILSDELAEPTIGDRTPNRIGRYTIIRELGRGGMGVVYEAEQENPKRRVALKVIRQAFGSEQLMSRFRQEAHVLGQLRHPGIAQIIEAGSADIDGAGVSYFTMEFIAGAPIDEFAESLGVRERVELMARVCEAVQHAHQRGVIHRDLKPANILVMEESAVTGTRSFGDGSSRVFLDSIGQPKILDFGIARLVDADVQVTTIETRAGQIVGTLGYMSPEQVEGAGAQLDTRCDVYALGVILYRLLTGRMPHDLRGKPLAEAARIIHEDEPSRPASLNKALRGDLDTIVSKAIEKNPDRRYPTAAALADDLRRHLAKEPITAHPPSAFYQMRKFASRNRAIVAGIAATFAALVVGLIGTGYFLVEATRQRDEAIAARNEADRERERTSAVAGFQADLLSDLSANSFGKRMISEIRRELRKQQASTPDGAPTEESIDHDRVAKALSKVNGTNVARALLSGMLADRAKKRLDKGMTDDPVTEARLRYSVAEMYRSLGMAEDALTQCELALELEREHLGVDHRSTLQAANLVAVRYKDVGRAAEAEALLRDTLERADRAFGAADPLTLVTMRILADLLLSTGALDEAESLLLSTLEAQKRTFGSDSSRTLKTHNTYCALLLRQGKIDDALSCFRETLRLHEQVCGPDHKRTLVVRNNLMGALFNKGRFEAAAPIAADVIASNVRLLGDEHPNTIMSRNNLGVVLLNLGRASEAEALFRRAYNDGQASLNPAHEVRMKSTSNLIDALLALDRPGEAVPLCHELIDVRRGLDPAEPGLVAQTMEQLGTAHFRQKEFADARDAWGECVSLRAGISSDHWLTNRARSKLGSTLTAMMRLDEAERLLLDSFQALDAQRNSIPDVAGANCVENARRRIVDLYVAWDRPGKAEEWRARGRSPSNARQLEVVTQSD
ncbi:MAG TPA: serine/threonine-protein kinase [Phycisphaerae bacterium]|nr:serine/threonine-protein kinase [Phycisphaerae bacterium]HRW55861.1 serine/threonine-protein kinase [Phycisphaerae bacterium]